MSRPFTAEEDDVILREYSRRTFVAIAGLIGREPKSVVSRAHLLERRGLVDPSRRYHNRPWTADDVGELRGLAGHFAVQEIARRIKRTVGAVKVKMVILGVSRKQKASFCASDVGRIFDVDCKTVMTWLRAGYLVGRKSQIGAGQRKRWAITAAAVERFIVDHSERYILSRIHDRYWRPIAERATKHGAVTVPEAAKHLRVSEATVRRHLLRGWLPGRRVPGAGNKSMWLIDRADLATFRVRGAQTFGLRYIKGHGRCGAQRLSAERWSTRWPACRVCGQTDKRHQGRGLCQSCYNRALSAERRERCCVVVAS